MKLKLAPFGGAVFGLLFAALLCANHQRQLAPEYILAQYPHTDMFDATAERHLHGDFIDVAFETHWFDDANTDLDSVTGCEFGAEGWKVCGKDSGDVALRAGHSLTKSQLAAFDKIAPTLPDGVSKPPLANLLIVSFWRDGKWTTRIYDRAHLPLAVVKAHRILGIKGFDKSPTAATK